MHFMTHSNLVGRHAVLSPSSYHWLGYSDDKLERMYRVNYAKVVGTKLHEFAKDAISLRRRMPNDDDTVNMYVNDAIDMRLTPEQVLYYSENCFGTADAIGIVDGVLHVHDLKNGYLKTSFNQPLIYSALFFLEYGNMFNLSPNNTPVELRIYQQNKVFVDNPSPEVVVDTMRKIVNADNVITSIRMKGE